MATHLVTSPVASELCRPGCIDPARMDWPSLIPGLYHPAAARTSDTRKRKGPQLQFRLAASQARRKGFWVQGKAVPDWEKAITATCTLSAAPAAGRLHTDFETAHYVNHGRRERPRFNRAEAQATGLVHFFQGFLQKNVLTRNCAVNSMLATQFAESASLKARQAKKT